MDESKSDKNKQIDIEDFIKEQKSENNNKDENEKENNIDKQNIENKNDIDNQSQIKQINSMSKSFESEKIEKNEFFNKEKEIETQEINDINSEKEKTPIIKEQKLEEKKQQNEEDKKEDDKITKKKEKKEKKENKKDKTNNNNEGIVKEPNREPKLGNINKYQLNSSIFKIKNKSLEQKMKTLLSKDNEDKEDENKNENTFINKVKDLKRELSKKNEINKLKKIKIKFETFKNYEINNRYKNYVNSDIKKKDFFNVNLKDLISNNENKYKELKEKYFASSNKNYNKNDLFLGNEKPIISYSQTIRKPYNITYRFTNYMNTKPILYKKNVQRRENDKINDEIINLINSTDTFDIILQKLKKSKNKGLEKNKNDNQLISDNRNNLLYNSKNINHYKSYCTKNTYNSKKFENNKKLQTLMNDVFQEIKDRKINSYDFKNRLSTMKSKLKRNDEYKTKKSKNENFDYLLNLCSKESLKKYSKSQKKFLD